MLTSVLVAVGELAQVSGPEMAVYADDLFSIIIEMLQVCHGVLDLCCGVSSVNHKKAHLRITNIYVLILCGILYNMCMYGVVPRCQTVSLLNCTALLNCKIRTISAGNFIVLFELG